MTAAPPLVELKDVSKTFRGRHGIVRALQDVSVIVQPGETVGIVGESGSGKTTLGRVILGMLAVDSGIVSHAGKRIGAGDASWRSKVSVVLQEPELALNPRMAVSELISEPLRVRHRNMSRAERRSRVLDAMTRAHLAHDLVGRYPRELSGGQQQRVGIARAIVTSPRLIVLDEPTASLDVSIRGQILDTLREAQHDLSVSYVLISHDMATISRLAHRTLVLYHGCVVESGPSPLVSHNPVHPYTIALMSAVLPTDPRQKAGQLRLAAPTGGEAEPRSAGCVLRGRCPEEVPDCTGRDVVLVPCRDGRELACVGEPGRSAALTSADPAAATGTTETTGESPAAGAPAATGNPPEPERAQHSGSSRHD